MSEHVRRIRLRPTRGRVPEFHAGQYLKIIHPSGREIPYSIATPPEVRDALELHFQPIEGSDDAPLMEALLRERTLTLELPFGDCCVEAPLERAMIIVAAATGYAQAKSVIEHVLSTELDVPLQLYWGVKTSTELYDMVNLARLAASVPMFDFHPVVELDAGNWRGRRGTPAAAILEDHADLASIDVMLCGGPGMVYATVDMLASAGLDRSNARSDVFTYAPRG